jgi:hypothetical protein
MRFEYHHPGLDGLPKISVDGTVEDAVHLSHWKGNRTPPALKADTSTEIALNLVASPDPAVFTRGIDLVTNNHFDTDGVLSVWTVLAGRRALDLRARLVAAAAAGDFAERTTEDGVRASVVIQGSDDPTDSSGSPLARQLAGGEMPDDARAYALVLPEVERVLARTDDYEPLWRDPWRRIALGLESFERGASTVEEFPEERLSLVRLAPALYGTDRFSPASHAAPFTAITTNARGQVFLIARPTERGWAYRIDWPYYSWAETVVRPPVPRRDLGPLVARLNELEGGGAGTWALDPSELSSAAKFSGPGGEPVGSRIAPETVAAETRAALRCQAPAVAAG